MAQPIGSLRVDLSASIADFKTNMKAARDSVFRNGSAMQKTMQKVGQKFTSAAKAMTSFQGIMTGTAMIAGMVYAIKRNLEYADTIAKTADKIGITTKALQEYRYIADRSGVDTEKLDKAFAKFAVGIGDLKAGTGTLYTLLNKNNKALMGQLVAADNTTEALDIYFNALKDVENQNDRASLAAAAFGAKAGVGMTLMVDNIDTLRDRFKRLGVEIDEKLLRGAEEAKDNIDDLTVVIKNSLAGALVAVAPQLGQAAADMAMWVASNKDFITQDIPNEINDMAKSVGDFTNSTEYKAIMEYWEIMAGAAIGLRIGGAKGALIGAGAGAWVSVYRDIKDMIGEASDEATVYENIQEAIKKKTKEISGLQRVIREDPLLSTGAVQQYKEQIETLNADIVKLTDAQRKLNQETEEIAAPKVGRTPAVPAVSGVETETEQATKAIDAIEKQIDALEQQRDTFGMTSKEVALYHLKMQGATDKQLKQAAAILDAIAAKEGDADAQEKVNDLIDEGKSLTESLMTGTEQYAATVGNLDVLLKAGAISQETYNRGIEKAKEDLEGLADKGEDSMSKLQQAIEGWGRDSTDAIVAFARTGEMSFSDMVDSMIDDLMRMVIQQQIMGPLFEGIGGFIGGLFPSAHGNVFQNGNLIPFARGGIVTQPTVFPMATGAGLMGEAGPEAIMPLTRIGGDLGVKAAGGGVEVNIINNVGADVSTSERTTADGQKAIDVYIDQAMAKKLGQFGSQSNRALRQMGGQQPLTGR